MKYVYFNGFFFLLRNVYLVTKDYCKCWCKADKKDSYHNDKLQHYESYVSDQIKKASKDPPEIKALFSIPWS